MRPDSSCEQQFAQLFGMAPTVSASAPGRLEVLGNHTDYNAGLTLSCAVSFRCHACLAPLDEPVIKIASTAYESEPLRFPLGQLAPQKNHWSNYVLGMVASLQDRGHAVPGFAMLIDSAVPRSAGVSSSAAIQMAALTGLDHLSGLSLSPMELATIGQLAESTVVGAQTGLLDQLTSLLAQHDHLLAIDFQSFETQSIRMPTGWCFVAIDSGVKHDLTHEYNQRRAACESAAHAMGVKSLREANEDMLARHRSSMTDEAWHCAHHVIHEIARVAKAKLAVERGDIHQLGQLMFASHHSSQVHFRNSCIELDELVDHARNDTRCVGARLCGGGFGGITIHLVRLEDAEEYRQDALAKYAHSIQGPRWSAVCPIQAGACLHAI